MAYNAVLLNTGWWRSGGGGGRGGSTPLYNLSRDVPPHRVGFLRCFGLKTGILFAHFGLESGIVFGGTTRVYEVFIVSVPNELERKRNM